MSFLSSRTMVPQTTNGHLFSLMGIYLGEFSDLLELLTSKALDQDIRYSLDRHSSRLGDDREGHSFCHICGRHYLLTAFMCIMSWTPTTTCGVLGVCVQSHGERLHIRSSAQTC